jgi:hypothetical protein
MSTRVCAAHTIKGKAMHRETECERSLARRAFVGEALT